MIHANPNLQRSFAAQPRQRNAIVGDFTLGHHPDELECKHEAPADCLNLWTIGVDLGMLVDPAAMAVVRDVAAELEKDPSKITEPDEDMRR